MNRFHKIVLLWICFSIQYAKAQAFTFELKAYTSQSNSADTPGDIGISFLVNGVWTQTETFFTGANKGDLKTKSFTTSTHPTKLKFLSNSNNNAWGYWKVVFADKTILLDPNGETGSPIGTVPYWVDGDSSEGTPTFQEHNLAVTYTFTNAGATGREGPEQSDINTAYQGTNLEDKVTINTRGIQEWTVPESGTYRIEAWGAEGGAASGTNGGKGAFSSGLFTFNDGQKLFFNIGQKGTDSTGGTRGGGGGGGSFIYDQSQSLKIIAGGGGGTSYQGNSGENGKDNVVGGAGGYTSPSNGNGGITDNGGGGGTGGGGGGVISNGVSNNWSGGGESNGGRGGDSDFLMFGGFGGGGGAFHGGGGGGGYSGGSGGSYTQGGGGGGSYNSGTDQVNTAGVNNGHGKVIITLLSSADSNDQQSVPFIFTNANAVGREGPTQSQIDDNYSGTNLENKVTINTRGFQEWAVPEGGQYKIEVWGASGGSSTYGTSGKGAYMSGKFILEESQLLKIIAGQTGIGNSNGAGGGGGSFVVNGVDSTLLIAAGGGGGAGGYLETTINPHLQDGKDAVSGTNGTDAQTQGPGAGFTSLGQGGSSGSGGTGGVSNHPGAGGAGFLTDGTMGQNTAGYHAFSGVSFSSGFIGGDGRGKPNGGFGGGGSTSHGGGGGGGYSGGGGGVWTHPGGADWGHGGGGGGSFNSGTDQNNTSGVNIGHGKVIITFLASANEAPLISQGEGPISKVTSEDTLTTWTTSELNATDSDTNASRLSWSVLTPPSNGTATVDGNGTSPQTFTYLPNANFHGSDSFAVMVSDGDKNDSITVNLSINQINDSTIISGDINSTIDAGTIASGDINATDPDGLTDGSYFAVTQNPLHGSALVDQIDGNWTYIPQSDFFGDDNFTVTITDDLNQSTTQLIHIVVNPTTSVSFTFTNSGATGRYGPTQSNINSSYNDTNLANSVTVNTQGIQEWIVPASGTYSIEAMGASTPQQTYTPISNDSGLGAKMKGNFLLSKGDKLFILVGQKPDQSEFNGGAGGSFIAKGSDLASSTPLLVAGGAGSHRSGYNASGFEHLLDGVTTTSGVSTQHGGGTNGSGGLSNSSSRVGAGGAGFHGNGNAPTISQGTYVEAKSFLNGGVGGYFKISYNSNEHNGGFGGGGAGGWGGSGGGGGYSGGGAGNNGNGISAQGGGGGSFNSGTNQVNQAGANEGHGKVIITFISSLIQNEAPVISQGTGPISKVTSEDTLTTWSVSELNATDSDTNASQLSWSVLTPPTNGTATVDGNGTSPQTFTYLPNANFHGSDSFSVMVSDGDANDSITINLTINPVDDPVVITDGLLISYTFPYTGADQTYAIPSGTEKLYIKLWGAGGGTGGGTHRPKGGGGGYTESTITVPQNVDSLTIIVGEKGNATWSSSNLNSTYGGGGGSGNDSGNSGGQGGGRSAIRLSDGTEILTAGGGGGGGFGSTSRTGGEGGGLTGKQGHNSGNIAGHGGTQTTGGLKGDGGKNDGENGSQYQGGKASIVGANGYGGGGAGGGYWGGGGGGGSDQNHGAGGGGSGFVGRNGTDFLQGENYGAVSSPADLTSRTDSITGISYELTKCLQANGANPAIILGDYGKSDHHGFVQIIPISSIGSSISKSLTEDSFIFGDLNASDPDGMTDGSYFSISQVAQHGTLSINSETGAWTYAPDDNFYGQDQAQIKITDDLDGSSVIDFHFSVTPVEDPALIFGDFNQSVSEDGTALGDINATDIDGLTDGSYFSISDHPANGIAAVDPIDGKWTYTPHPHFFGDDNFSISLTDDLNQSYFEIIEVFVNPVDDPAIIIGDFNQSILEDGTALGDINATDIDGLTDGSYYAITNPPSHGSASIDPTDGNWTYLPHPNFFGDDNFTISITDDQNHSYYENIQIVVLPVDDHAIIYGDFNQSIDEDGSAYGNLIATDIDGLTDGSYYAITTPPSHGSASIDPTEGNWTYIPHPHFFGDDNFTISITDDQNHSYLENIQILIHPVDDPAIINGDFNQSIDEDGIAYGNLIALDIDGLTDGSYYAITNPPSHGSASIDPTDGNWTYLPHPHFFGDDNFTISITDDLNHSYLENIQLLVHPVDDPAIISGDLQATTYLDISSHGQIIAKDIDGLAKDIIFEISRLPKKGIAEIDPIDGNWAYLPTHQDFGDDMFEISVTDIDGNKTFQTITLNAQINHPLLKTITPILSAEESIILQGEVISTGGSTILNTGFLLDTSPTFSNPNKIYSVADKNGSLESAISIPQEIVFIKSFAITSIGEFFGQTIRYNPFSSKKFWQAHAIPMDADWMQSDWFGMFTPVTENWIYHLRMEWLFISDFTPKHLWVWSEQQDWIWTTEEVFPFFYSNKTGNWLYLLPTKLGDKTFYNYETEELE